jgi:phospholipid-binding lipoprotein MlaA
MSLAICRVYPVIVALYLVLSLSGCATTTTVKFTPEVPAMHSVAEFGDDERVIDIADPWERFNLNIYKFNYNFDRYLFLPVVSGYEFITPTLIQKGISNFFSNVGEVRTFYNSLFQLKGKKVLITFGRFATNTTIGIGGLFDPATRFGMEAQSEDFGQTLGYWGVDSGPYLVVPVLGPNTLRSAGGFAVDAGVHYAIVGTIDPFQNVENGYMILPGISTLEAIDMRHKEKFRYYESGYPFEYYMFRFLYNKKSELLLMK